MLFTTASYFAFLLVVLTLWFQTPVRYRWVVMLAASYFFYATWNPGFVLLLALTTGVAYGTALRIGRTPDREAQKRWLRTGVVLVLAPLLFYKYFNFFSATLQAGLKPLGLSGFLPAHHYLLPVGISFYTFQTLSYLIDVYRGYVRPEKHAGIFAVYVAFFPQLLAGPIERGRQLLPQWRHPHPAFSYSDAVAGLQLIIWGLFKKIVLANRLQEYVDTVFDQPEQHYGLGVWLACFFFSFQLFCDFSAYSDIAVGSARMFGVRLSQNFANRVYASRSRTEFWQGWHRTLTAWFRDYIYTPLSKQTRDRRVLYLNLLVVYLLTGLWHGAQWGFIVWGLLNGLWVLTEQVTRPARRAFFERLGFGPELRLHQILSTMLVFTAGALMGLWFRAATFAEGKTLFRHLFVADWSLPASGSSSRLLVIVLGLVGMDVVHRLMDARPIDVLLQQQSRWVRWAYAVGVAELILTLGRYDNVRFYYFQF
ncbi:MBOAT family O-acyltransferase [Larkinella soli]|uniref:MBOAT family O-acyltransferase n=1 Tax=Larkinella soli TaxID=1770527 RepID=UPI000FFB368F|nr:MBOAT family O-acyltransferase [Larkinella soli]